MKIAICDDEAFFRKDLIKRLDIYFQARRVYCVYFEFTDGVEILNSKTSFDLIFMDYQMKNTNGLTSALKLREYNIDTKIIFISSFTEIVFDVFSVKAFRFLTKPIDDKRLIEALDAFVEEKNNAHSVIVRDIEAGESVTLPVTKVICAQADNVYTLVYTIDKEYRYNDTLSAFSKELTESCFFRTHRSYLINLHYVRGFSKTGISLITNEKVLISKLRYSSFKNLYFDFIKKESMCLL